MIGLTALIFLGIVALSWLISCIVIKFVAMCFGLTCTWLMATGIWILLWFLNSLFSRASK